MHSRPVGCDDVEYPGQQLLPATLGEVFGNRLPYRPGRVQQEPAVSPGLVLRAGPAEFAEKHLEEVADVGIPSRARVVESMSPNTRQYGVIM